MTFNDLLQFFFLISFVRSLKTIHMPKPHRNCFFFSLSWNFLKKITLLTSVTPTWPFDPSRSCDINGRWSLLLCPSLVGMAWSMLKLWVIEMLPERRRNKERTVQIQNIAACSSYVTREYCALRARTFGMGICIFIWGQRSPGFVEYIFLSLMYK